MATFEARLVEENSTFTIKLNEPARFLAFEAAFVEETPQFSAKFMKTQPLKAKFGEIQTVTDGDWYEGKYTIIPSPENQVLETQGKTMKNDVTVKSIPYYETSNFSGITVYIGSEV